MTRTVGMLLAILMVQKACSQSTLKIGGLIQSTSIGPRGRYAFELWKSWADAAAPGYTVELYFSDYNGLNDTEITAAIQSMTAPGTCETSSSGCVHVLVCPYTSGASNKVIAAVPAGSTIPILVWGGASDSIFSSTCVDRSCFGGFTVASSYMSPSLSVIAQARESQSPLTVAAITNANGFSRSVDAGGKAYIASEPLQLSLMAEYELSVARTSLAEIDLTQISNIVAQEPDVFMISGHPGDVEEVIAAVQAVDSYQPKAIIATNAFSSGMTDDYMEGVIMPEQWAEDPVMTDSIVGWTSPVFKAALEAAGHVASYHAASAGGLAVMLSHAMAMPNATVSNIASMLSMLPATPTFYGSFKWNSDGSIDASTKPMYGKQALGRYGLMIVAPTGPLEYPLEQPVSCGEVREMFRANECCGQPNKVMSMDVGRRLEGANTPKPEDAILEGIKKTMQTASKGSKKRLADQITTLVNQLK